ncbi:IclR family transcriptional regulator [Natrialbaceae archaeon AArc-T1-2]|uniref:IclR family transcriptional regulator n=1 Tax=Natrialbaceae archaeon AArc-T1-2 TaxID=3053904 RepID=UPI003D2F89F4
MHGPSQTGTPLKTVVRTFEIVEFIKDREGARVLEVSEHFDLPNSTVHSYLASLHELGYLVKDGDEYHVGLQFLHVGGHAATRHRAYQMARPKVKELAMETNERAQFIVEEFGYGIYLHMETGDNAVETDVRIGKMASLHTTSAGKAILAHLPEEQVMRIVDRYGLSKRTENTITDPDALLEELETIRDRGYAYNDGERITGMRAVGVPITDVEDDVVGALSVSGPAHRMKGNWYEKEIPDLLLGTANELELNLTYQ